MNNCNFKEVTQNSKTMAEAAKKLGIPFNTFKRKAIKMGIYRPNQSGKGIKKQKENLLEIIIH